ncbi:MAG: 7-carboxy-7-deazaguanine synthase QueE [Rickettsiales bacterium]
MFGDNPIRKPLKHDGNTLEVKSIFPTLQGEGPYAGWPSVFIRLGGCNLACNFCDTEFEDYKEMSTADIIKQIKTLAEHRKLVVITGGEPFRQNISPLCEALIAENFKIQIETNGTLYRELPEAVEIVCSPKNTTGQYAKVREDLLPRINAFKFIVACDRDGYGKVEEVGQSTHNTPVYVQPMDEYDEAKNNANLSLAMQLASQHGYLLSLQTHKILGIE